MAPAEVVLVDIADRVARHHAQPSRAAQRVEPRPIASSSRRRFSTLDANDDVDVMILTGADPAFSAGVDLKEFGSGQATESSTEPPTWAVVMTTARLPFRGALPPRTKPLIGAINGVAVTGGLEVALNCDFLVASERARFADTHSRVGVMPGWGLTVLLPQRVGVARAREMSLTGNYVDAPTALAWGLVNHVVPHDELLPYARALGGRHRLQRPDGRAAHAAHVRRRVAHDGRRRRGTIEDRVSREWEGPGFDPASIEARRQKIIDRGRAQQSAEPAWPRA